VRVELPRLLRPRGVRVGQLGGALAGGRHEDVAQLGAELGPGADVLELRAQLRQRGQQQEVVPAVRGAGEAGGDGRGAPFGLASRTARGEIAAAIADRHDPHPSDSRATVQTGVQRGWTAAVTASGLILPQDS
jgi:hypothetical protein